MRSDLEDRVGGRVDDRRPGAYVFLTQLLEDLGAGSRLVAKRRTSNAGFECVHHFRRKPIRIQGKRFGKVDADHLPMAGGCILAGGRQRATPVGSKRGGGGWQPWQWLDVPQAQCAQIRQLDWTLLRDVSKRVAGLRVKVRLPIRHGADSHAVEYDPDHAFEFV